MPAQDSIHDAVVNALQTEGWRITDDPLTVEFGDVYLFIDLGATTSLTAERGGEKIAVEIKSFLGKSKVADLQQAVGQYAVYRSFLRQVEPERAIYLAVSLEVYNQVFLPPTGELVRSDVGIQLIVIDVDEEEVVSWVR
ncbi:MAG: XisH family protein [Planctomycetia bacterium]|nr:XisH family protein [Planctomycetia bacterium]